LKLAAREIGGIQIQNTATLVGNVCNASPAADGLPNLMALDAEVELASLDGRRQMPIGDFVIGNRKTKRRPDELVTALLVPRTAADAQSSFLKLGGRKYLIISIVMVAVVVEIAQGSVEQARIAVGACSEIARRLPALEEELSGRPVGSSLATAVRPEHLSHLTPIDDLRATANYRRQAALVLLRRSLNRLRAA
jgi:CO/xanthine dehydrogenase FAD-binding subunit